MVKKFCSVLLVTFALMFAAGGVLDAQRGKSSSSSTKSVAVKGYTTKSGKTVQPYTRSAPGSAHTPAETPAPTSWTTPPAVTHPSTSPRTLTTVPFVWKPVLTGAPKPDSRARTSGPDTTATFARPTASGKRNSPVAPRLPFPRPASKTACASCPRDDAGRIARSEAAKRDFLKATGFPNGRPGWIVDHIKPLACGGTDTPSNMQWQTDAAAKAKDRVERKGCK